MVLGTGRREQGRPLTTAKVIRLSSAAAGLRGRDQPIKRTDKGKRVLSVDRYVMAFAGGFIVISVLLAVFHNLYGLLFTALVGINLLQAAFTGFCPLAIVLKKIGIKAGAAF